MGGGVVTDRHIAWKPKRLWIPIREFGFDNNGTDDISLSQGTPVMAPASGTLEVAVLPMTTADEVHIVRPIPYDMDRTGCVAARVHFIHASTDASDAPVFKLGALFYAKQAQTVEAQANADVVTSITHGGTSATDDSAEVTPWFNCNWKSYMTDTDLWVAISLELDALGSAGADECEVIGVELAYDVKACDNVSLSTLNMVDDNTL